MILESSMKNSLLLVLFLGFWVMDCFSADNRVVGYDANYSIIINGNTNKVQLTCVIPKDRSNMQRVLSMNYSRPPIKVYDKDGNRYAEFLIESEKGEVKIKISAVVEIFKHDLKSAKAGMKVFFDSKSKYLLSEKNVELEDSLIQTLGHSMVNKDTLSAIKSIYDYVTQNMVYSGFNAGQVGAAKALKQLAGDCTEFTDVFVALCRSCSIPAMAVEGLVLNYSVTPKHSWAEVFCSPYGWIRFDPTPGNSNVFNKLVNQYIQFSTVRNDENLRGGHFYRYTYWGEPVLILEEIKMKMESKN